MSRFRTFRRPLAVLGAILLTILVAAPAMAREIHGYAFEVGLMDEPVFVGQKSGLEFFVSKGDQPVEGLEKTLQAEAIYGASKRPLPIKATFGEKGAYQSVFFPTAAGKYTFHIFGTLPDGTAMDESFTSSTAGFNEVQEAASGEFPVQFPSQAELVRQAQAGSDAGGQLTIALVLGGLGVLLGLAALAVAVAGRTRAH